MCPKCSSPEQSHHRRSKQGPSEACTAKESNFSKRKTRQLQMTDATAAGATKSCEIKPVMSQIQEWTRRGQEISSIRVVVTSLVSPFCQVRWTLQRPRCCHTAARALSSRSLKINSAVSQILWFFASSDPLAHSRTYANCDIWATNASRNIYHLGKSGEYWDHTSVRRSDQSRVRDRCGLRRP